MEKTKKKLFEIIKNELNHRKSIKNRITRAKNEIF